MFIMLYANCWNTTSKSAVDNYIRNGLNSMIEKIYSDWPNVCIVKFPAVNY